MRQPIRVRDLPESPAPGVMLVCAECGETYSASRGDYFLAAPDTAILCCGEPVRLMRRNVVYVDVQVGA
jgi:hypothetical protein